MKEKVERACLCNESNEELCVYACKFVRVCVLVSVQSANENNNNNNNNNKKEKKKKKNWEAAASIVP